MMTDQSRAKWIWMAAVLATAAVIGMAYAYRTTFGGLPLVGSLIAGSKSPASVSESNQSGMPMPGGASTAATEQPRGDVTIDTRRQQLIGVRVVPVKSTMLGATVRTTAVVHY